MDIKDGIRQLLNKEYLLFQRMQKDPQYATTPEGYGAMEEWINDVDIFNQKYLTSNPLHKRIDTIIFHRQNTAISDLVACLKSILNDMGGDTELKDYEQFLATVIGRIDLSSDILRIFQYEMKSGERMIIKKLEDLGLIENVTYMGINYVGFDLTYDGLHYFDVKQMQNDKTSFITGQIEYPKYEVFISHASKDKLDYVEQLKTTLDKLNINIFYDKDSIKWGDNWKQRILDGVASSEFAIIVISENFFGREWTEKELHELLNRQNDSGQKIILPLLHNISIRQLEDKYPKVADIHAISTADHSFDEIAFLFAEQLIKRLKEERV